MYESLLESSLIVRLLVVVVPLLAIVVPCAKRSLGTGSRGVENDSVMSMAAGFVGAAFIFIGSFANVTAWQGAGNAVSSLKRELSSLAIDLFLFSFTNCFKFHNPFNPITRINIVFSITRYIVNKFINRNK